MSKYDPSPVPGRVFFLWQFDAIRNPKVFGSAENVPYIITITVYTHVRIYAQLLVRIDRDQYRSGVRLLVEWTLRKCRWRTPNRLTLSI